MKHWGWIGTFTALVGILLLAEGVFTVLVVDAARGVEVLPLGPTPTAGDVAWIKNALPAMYVVAAEGLIFGLVAVICAGGLFAKQQWAPRVLLAASIALAVVTLVAVFLAPHQWQTQGGFLLMCACLWWEAKKWWLNEASAV